MDFKYTIIVIYTDGNITFINTEKKFEKKNIEPAFAAMHGPHSLVRIGPGCADRA